MTERDTRREVERLVIRQPTRSAADISRAVGISRQRVQKILSDLGYELTKVWRKKK